MIPQEVSHGVFRYGGRYYTVNLLPGESHHGEELRKIRGVEYRHWEPHRSKLGAYIRIRGKLPVKADMNVLYLGAGDGTTVSYLSDVLTHGRIYAVEMSRRPYRHLLELSTKRKNIFPILGDARHPHEYTDLFSKVDLIYQDIAQRDQAEIFLRNIPFLKEGYGGMLAVKARSIHVSRKSSEIYGEVEEKLGGRDVTVAERTDIGRWQRDHVIFCVEKPKDIITKCSHHP